MDYATASRLSLNLSPKSYRTTPSTMYANTSDIMAAVQVIAYCTHSHTHLVLVLYLYSTHRICISSRLFPLALVCALTSSRSALRALSRLKSWNRRFTRETLEAPKVSCWTHC